MTKKLLMCFALGLGLTAWGDSTPLARWSFEDASDLGKDAMGYANLTSAIATTSYPTPASTSGIWGGLGVNLRRESAVGNALVSDVGRLPSGNAPFTVTTWIKSDSSDTTAYILCYLAIEGGVPQNWVGGSRWSHCWYLRFCSDTTIGLCFNGWRVQPSASDDNDIVGAIPSGVRSDNTWHHVAFSRDANNLVRLYWDGVKIAEHTITASVTEKGRLIIGSYETNNKFSGDYDEVCVFDSALSDGDIAQECYRGNDKGIVLDEKGRIILDAPAGSVVTNELSYNAGFEIAKTGGGEVDLYHSSMQFRGVVSVSNGVLRTGERSTFCNATGFSAAAGTTLEFGRSGNYGASFAGEGEMKLSGQSLFNLTGDISAFCGTWASYLANVHFGTAAAPLQPNATSSLVLGGGGFLRFYDDVSVASLSGEGMLGGVALSAGKTLTVGGEGEAAFAGILAGQGSLVKEGTGTLALSGASEFTNVAVKAGTLALDRSVPIDGRLYRFEVADEIGADSGAAPALPLKIVNGKNTPEGVTHVKQVEGVVGKAAHVEVVTDLNASFLVTDDNAALPRGTTPYTFSAWLRPQANSGKAAYIARCQCLTGTPEEGWGNTGWGGTGWYLLFHGNGRKISIDYPNGWAEGDNRAEDERATGEIPEGACCDGKWHHVVFTLDGNKALRLYWDGALIGENLAPVRCSVSDTARLQLGSYELKTNHPFNGDFDEVQYVEGVWSAERVAAEYAARAPSCDATVPAPLAHWTFDAFETDDNGRFFRDFGSAGWHFYERTKTSGRSVALITDADANGKGANGGAAFVDGSNSGAFLRVGDFCSPKETLSGGNPDFTLSIRLRNCANNESGRQVVMSFGSAQMAAQCLRLTKESIWLNDQTRAYKPMSYRAITGNTNGTDGWEIGDTYATHGADTPWTTLTFVNKAATRTVTLYRDGKDIGTYATNYALELDRILLFAGYYAGGTTPSTYTGFAIDDMRVYRELLTAAQVKAIVLEQANVTPNTVAAAKVDLSEGTALQVKGGSHVAEGVAGAGSVVIASLATFGAKDWTGFSGVISGAGTLALYGRLPSGVTPATDFLLVAGAETDAGGAGLPIVDAPERSVKIAPSGVVRFTGVAQGRDLAGKRFVIARAAEFVAPSDFSGWKVEPADAECPAVFSVQGGTFRLKVKGGGGVIILR